MIATAIILMTISSLNTTMMNIRGTMMHGINVLNCVILLHTHVAVNAATSTITRINTNAAGAHQASYSFYARKQSYCFQRVLSVAILSVRLSVRHTNESVKNGAS